MARVAAELVPTGLLTRGFALSPDEQPDIPAGVIVLVGNAGPAMWRQFSTSGMSSLDSWVKRTIDPIAESLGARALYPSDGPPYAPFHRWALASGTVHASPIGLLIDPEFGLWHAYRAALVFAGPIPQSEPQQTPHPCETCAAKPCLTACPVDAFTPDGFETEACRAFVTGTAGDCGQLGCAARRACPIGTDYVYEPAQAAFHMAAFAGAGLSRSRPDTGRTRDQ